MPSSASYPARHLGRNGPLVSAIGLGAMRLGGFNGPGPIGEITPEKEAHALFTYAADRGVTFWDTSIIYGESERLIGSWFEKTGRRSEIFLATKYMRLPGESKVPSGSPSYIHEQIEQSLGNLKTDYIDLYYQHRVDGTVPIEVVLEQLRPYVECGKIRYLGLSECSSDHLRRARAVQGIGEKVIACQMAYSPLSQEIVTNGFVTTARELGVAIVVYSPLGGGFMTGRFKSRYDFDPSDVRFRSPRMSDENFPKNLELVDKFRAVAVKYSASTGQITLAWIIAENPDFVPIPGSRSIERLEENAKAGEIVLDPKDVQALREIVDTMGVRGERGSSLASNAHLPAKFPRSGPNRGGLTEVVLVD